MVDTAAFVDLQREIALFKLVQVVIILSQEVIGIHVIC